MLKCLFLSCHSSAVIEPFCMKRPTKIIWTLVGLSMLCGLAAFAVYFGPGLWTQTLNHQLVNAVESHRSEKVQSLIDNGADPNWRKPGDRDGHFIPMIVACRRGDVEILEFLVNAGGDPFTKKGLPYNENLVHVVAGRHVYGEEMIGSCDRVACINYLVERGVDVNEPSRVGQTALSIATKHGRADIVAVLIEHGADVDVQDLDGNTGMHAICAQPFRGEKEEEIAQIKIVKMSLKAGCDLTIKNEAGETALDVAIKNKRTDLEKLVRAHMSKNK